MKIVVWLLVLLGIHLGEPSRNVPDGEKYIINVSNRMMELLAETSIVTSLPMLEMTGLFNKTSYGINLDGEVKFHSGFLINIGEISSYRYVEITNDKTAKLTLSLLFHDVQASFDLNTNFKENRQPSSMIITFKALEFDLTITQNHSTSAVDSTIKFANFFGSTSSIKIENFPSNPYTQLISEQVKTVNSATKLFDQLKASFYGWSSLQKYLQQATEEVNFPQICYTCQ
ncbi:unnamed protein product [Diamesa serratosioi]